jgi:hypothetical protein
MPSGFIRIMKREERWDLWKQVMKMKGRWSYLTATPHYLVF